MSQSLDKKRPLVGIAVKNRERQWNSGMRKRSRILLFQGKGYFLCTHRNKYILKKFQAYWYSNLNHPLFPTPGEEVFRETVFATTFDTSWYMTSDSRLRSHSQRIIFRITGKTSNTYAILSISFCLNRLDVLITTVLSVSNTLPIN